MLSFEKEETKNIFFLNIDFKLWKKKLFSKTLIVFGIMSFMQIFYVLYFYYALIIKLSACIYFKLN